MSERSNVSSVRNGNGIRGRVESGRGWARGRAENSVRKTRDRGRVGKSGLLASGRRTIVNVPRILTNVLILYLIFEANEPGCGLFPLISSGRSSSC